MTDLNFDPVTTATDTFEAGLDRLRAAFYGPRCVRLEKRVAEQDAQIAELKRFHAEACARAAAAETALAATPKQKERAPKAR